MSKVSDPLSTVLADTYALAVKTHGAHWNCTGAQFFALHAAFGTQYEALFLAADELAERLRALGERAPRGIASIAKATTIEEIKSEDGLALAKSLRDDHRDLERKQSVDEKVELAVFVICLEQPVEPQQGG